MNPMPDNPKPPGGPLWPVWKEKWSEDTALKDALETDPHSVFRALFRRSESRRRKLNHDDQGA